ncbi:MAG: hypothetical protein LBF94_03535 [Puniceicoccales bacterium]|jgi:hypothetical protein|nr:hypothetical protein [Puniceicoccales bacterium]
MDNNVTQHKRVHYKGISRIDSKTTKGWLVRGYKNGKRYSKLFSDRKIGSSEEALSQALIFCKELSARLKAIPADPRAKKIVYSDVRNTTGVIGISRLTKPGKNGSKLEFYSVTWRPAPGEQKCTSFSIRKYGPEEAFRKAVVCRYNGLEKLHGRDIAVRIVGEDNVKKYILDGGAEKMQDKGIEMRATSEISAKARTASTVTA